MGGGGRGSAHFRRVYPPGSTNSPARHSPSAPRALAAPPGPGRHEGRDPQSGPPGPLPAHPGRGAGSSGTLLPELWDPGARTLSWVPRELDGETEQRARSPHQRDSSSDGEEGRSAPSPGSLCQRLPRQAGGWEAAHSPVGPGASPSAQRTASRAERHGDFPPPIPQPLLLLSAAETRGCPREEKGRRVPGRGQGAPKNAPGPGGQLARRAGRRHLPARAPLPARTPDLSTALHPPRPGEFPAAVPSDRADCGSGRQLHSLQPPPSHAHPGGCGRATTGRKFAIPEAGSRPGAEQLAAAAPMAEAPAPPSSGCRKGAAEQRGAGGRAPGRARAPAAAARRRLLAAPPPAPPPERRPRRAPPPIRGRRPQPRAQKTCAASSLVSSRHRRGRYRYRHHQAGFLRPLRPLPAARAGPSDGRGGTRRLRVPGPGGGARPAGREEPREMGRGTGTTRAASC
ncbi:collagen alpha-1(I) chain-like [Choloepus didactylus]|uniref:collagen alpha-1(I) chain-like n=1 Tax=Choloepus didactylus TaxID=27675 RepID=UPI0018A00D6B|nr:collagen alpha-1(I) chain-like [Choloepus didactylus]